MAPILKRVCRGRERSRARAQRCRPTLVESKVYRLSAHGNIIAPPACRCTTRSTRRSPCSASAKNTRRRCAATRCRASGATLVKSGVLNAAKADELSVQVAQEMEAAVAFAVKSPFPKLESALDNVYA